MKKNSLLDVEIKKITHWQKRIFDNFGVEIPLLSCRSSEELEDLYFQLARERGLKSVIVRIPKDEESYKNGDGETVGVLVNKQVRKAYSTGETNAIYSGILLDNSNFYDGLIAGVTIHFEMKESKKAVISYKWLTENYKKKSIIKPNKWANRI